MSFTIKQLAWPASGQITPTSSESESSPVNNVTLPILPYNVGEVNPTNYNSAPMPGNLPLLIDLGAKEKQISIEGYLADGTSSKGTLISNYVAKLRAMKFQPVHVDSPDDGYHGNYLMIDCQITEQKEYPTAFKYKITLAMGTLIKAY